jgi:hypothetical protein
MVFLTCAFSITHCGKGGKNYFRIFDFYPQTPCAFVRAKSVYPTYFLTAALVGGVFSPRFHRGVQARGFALQKIVGWGLPHRIPSID